MCTYNLRCSPEQSDQVDEHQPRNWVQLWAHGVSVLRTNSKRRAVFPEWIKHKTELQGRHLHARRTSLLSALQTRSDEPCCTPLLHFKLTQISDMSTKQATFLQVHRSAEHRITYLQRSRQSRLLGKLESQKRLPHSPCLINARIMHASYSSKFLNLLHIVVRISLKGSHVRCVLKKALAGIGRVCARVFLTLCAESNSTSKTHAIYSSEIIWTSHAHSPHMQQS